MVAAPRAVLVQIWVDVPEDEGSYWRFEKKTKTGRIGEVPVICSHQKCVCRVPANHNPHWNASAFNNAGTA